jgi:hypothetical protein
LLGKSSDAFIYYEQVEERDPVFRCVLARIARLSIKAGPAPEREEFAQMFDDVIVKD